MTSHPLSIAAVAVFALAYVLVLAEDFTLLRKSKPMMVAASAVWVLVAMVWPESERATLENRLLHTLQEYAELLLFLLAAMTFVNTMEERGLFDVMRQRLVSSGMGLRAMFWMTGALAFVLSPVLDNLTTALVLGAVTLAIGRGNRAFVVPACINIVVAANAGGAISPFGDITTLMVWQHGAVSFGGFLLLLVPSLVNWVVPAVFLSFSVPHARPEKHGEATVAKRGAWLVAALFGLTIAWTVASHYLLDLPAFLGMMTGLGLLAVAGHFLRRSELAERLHTGEPAGLSSGRDSGGAAFEFFEGMKRVEWDTLLFFYGVMMCIGGLDALGFLVRLSAVSYAQMGATWTNIGVGIASALIDNIPVMFSVLSINPTMSEGQWLLVTLTAGVGGSLLSIGSAAGVALMGQANGVYTFLAHLRWSWAIAMGYAASIWVHLWLNRELF